MFLNVSSTVLNWFSFSNILSFKYWVFLATYNFNSCIFLKPKNLEFLDKADWETFKVSEICNVFDCKNLSVSFSI
ncbi:hypothetical protein V3317_03730 [Mycoplasmopsis felis]